MMVVERKSGRVIHKAFKDFPSYFHSRDVLVLNDTRVIPARAWGQTAGRQAEFLFLKNLSLGRWEVLCRPARHVAPGSLLSFNRSLLAKVVDVGDEGKRVLDFGKQNVLGFLRKQGYAPLPPYIRRGKKAEGHRTGDLARYQTVYARRGRSIAAPTAGLHFTREILNSLQTAGVNVLRVDLEVGLATFQPVRAQRLEDHVMLEERYTVSPRSAREVNAAKGESRPITAVGTTVVRTLESAAATSGQDSPRLINPGTDSTHLFIHPGYRFKIVDRLLTNFHLPRSTLLMLVSAFAGGELIREAYQEAVRERYRFFSYGDCMLIL